MGGIGAHSPGMAFVEEQARFTPIAERYRRYFDKFAPLPTENQTAGRISGPNPAPKKRLVWRSGSSFFRVS